MCWDASVRKRLGGLPVLFLEVSALRGTLLSPFPLEDDQRKYAILFAATILAARKLNDIGSKPCPARECERWPRRDGKRATEVSRERWKEPLL